MENEMMDNYQI